jgi:hypothetical protein
MVNEVELSHWDDCGEMILMVNGVEHSDAWIELNIPMWMLLLMQ